MPMPNIDTKWNKVGADRHRADGGRADAATIITSTSPIVMPPISASTTGRRDAAAAALEP